MKKIILIILGILIVAGGTYYISKEIIWKGCNSYDFPMNGKQEERCTCPKGYKKFYGLNRIYCATNSQKPCNAHTDCPDNESCISGDGKNWNCSGIKTGCFFNNPEKPTTKMCGD